MYTNFYNYNTHIMIIASGKLDGIKSITSWRMSSSIHKLIF